MRLFRSAIIACAFAMFSAVVNAQTDYSINYNFQTSSAWTMNVHFMRNNVSQTLDVWAGPFAASWNGAKPGGFANSFSVYCVDLDHYDTTPTAVQVKPFTTNPVNPTGDYWDRLRKSAWLYAQFNPLVASATGLQREIYGAALQTAIWNVMEDSDQTVGAGSFYLTKDSYSYDPSSTTFNAITAQADSWLHTLYTSNPNTADGTLFQVDRTQMGSVGQDMIGPAALTPEGGSLILLAVGGIPLVGMLRIRQRRPNAG